MVTLSELVNQLLQIEIDHPEWSNLEVRCQFITGDGIFNGEIDKIEKDLDELILIGTDVPILEASTEDDATEGSRG